MSQDEFDAAVEPLGRYFCRRCAVDHVVSPARERTCMGVYAGMFFDPCWVEHPLNHNRPFDPMDAGESMDPEPTL